jgi:hypothetical protein
VGCGRRKRITALVLAVAGMPLHPGEGHLVAAALVQHFFPKVAVRYFLLAAVAPAVGFPLLHPSQLHGIHQVLRIRIQLDRGTALQRFQGLDGGGQFHAVVGGQAETAGELPALLVVHDNRSVTARPGVTGAGAVCVNGYSVHDFVLKKPFSVCLLVEANCSLSWQF